jgi:hypothetical protein
MALSRPTGVIKQKALMHAELGDGEYYLLTAYISEAWNRVGTGLGNFFQ